MLIRGAFGVKYMWFIWSNVNCCVFVLRANISDSKPATAVSSLFFDGPSVDEMAERMASDSERESFSAKLTPSPAKGLQIG